MWDMSLIDNNIHSHFMFKIETEFEHYSPDWIYLKVYNWVPQEDEEYMFDWANEMPYKVIKITENQTISELE